MFAYSIKKKFTLKNKKKVVLKCNLDAHVKYLSLTSKLEAAEAKVVGGDTLN